jgi:hypothetical protein
MAATNNLVSMFIAASAWLLRPNNARVRASAHAAAQWLGAPFR